MKTLPIIAIAIITIIFGQISGGIAQPEKSLIKEKKEIKMKKNNSVSAAVAQSGTCDWKSFKKPDDADLKKKLSPLQYEVTQQEGTEWPHANKYDKNYREGIYVDIVSGEPLFSSRDKYDSGTGWPSFFRPLEPGNVVENSLTREVRSKYADSHLGHVFNDGPQPTGLRYCMNSAALRFIPREDLEKEGYGKYRKLFE